MIACGNYLRTLLLEIPPTQLDVTPSAKMKSKNRILQTESYETSKILAAERNNSANKRVLLFSMQKIEKWTHRRLFCS